MTRAYRLGLTGSVGMGKSTTAAMFADEGLPVWDADAAVHALYGPDGGAVPVIAGLVPGAAGPAGVDRPRLREAILRDPTLLQRIEAAVHPLAAASREAFLREADGSHVTAVVLDIPLLYETGADAQMDGVVVVSAPADVQRQRVLARPGMDAATFERISARQMPDSEKRARANWVVLTTDLSAARKQVKEIVAAISRERRSDA